MGSMKFTVTAYNGGVTKNITLVVRYDVEAQSVSEALTIAQANACRFNTEDGGPLNPSMVVDYVVCNGMMRVVSK